MKRIMLLSVLMFVIGGCETVNEAGESIGTAVDNLGINSDGAAKDVGDAGNKAADNVKSGGE
jgi:predicted small secreted protein